MSTSDILKNIEKLLSFKNYTILVVGDCISDLYIGGDVERISPEAPVPVLKATWTDNKLGGAGNVVNNICALTAKARILSCIGNDQTGTNFIELLKKINVDTRYLIQDDSISTIKKTRIVAKNQQVIRIDRENKTTVPESFLNFVKTNINDIFESINAVILSDYGKGVLTPDLSQLLINKANELKIPIFVDPKGKQWEKYRNATMCTPNLLELTTVIDEKISQDMEDTIKTKGLDLCKKFNFNYLLVTRSEKGISLIVSNGSKKDFPTKKIDIVDVSGAGDTVISMITLCIVAGIDEDTSCILSNVAASIVISKFGTSVVSLDEIIEPLLLNENKMHTIDEIQIISNYLHNIGKKIVFTNGCFDLIHAGHIYSLENAHLFGDVLIVGLNSDKSVKKIKGQTRPIIDENDRACMLRSLRVVDYVVIFDDDTPEDLIHAIRPDVLIKGKDYEGKKIVGQDFVESYGGLIELIDLKPGISTTSIINRLHNTNT